MPLTVEAIYENGVLKPTGPLPLKEPRARPDALRAGLRPGSEPGRGAHPD